MSQKRITGIDDGDKSTSQSNPCSRIPIKPDFHTNVKIKYSQSNKSANSEATLVKVIPQYTSDFRQSERSYLKSDKLKVQVSWLWRMVLYNQ
jgi:hypothetical protein